MLIMRTTEDPTDPIGERIGAQQSAGLDHFALAMNPFGLYGVQPRTLLLGQKAAYDPHSSFAIALFDLAVMFAQPASDLAASYVPARVESQMRSRNFLPAASSFSIHHERNRVVILLTGRPSTNLSHISSSSGR